MNKSISINNLKKKIMPNKKCHIRIRWKAQANIHSYSENEELPHLIRIFCDRSWSIFFSSNAIFISITNALINTSCGIIIFFHFSPSFEASAINVLFWHVI